MTIIIFIVVLIALVLFHELGHFLAAKIFGVRVDEFGLGFPPRIIAKKWGETIYSLNWVPFGGFVKIFGEDDEAVLKKSEIKDSEANLPNGAPEGLASKLRNFAYQPWYIKIVVLVAGVGFNLLLAWFLFSAGLMSGALVSVNSFPSSDFIKNVATVITYVKPDSPAKKMGLTASDKISYLVSDTAAVEKLEPASVAEFIKKSEGKKVYFGITNSGAKEIRNFIVTPDKNPVGDYEVGIGLDQIGEAYFPFFPAVASGARMTYLSTRETARAFYQFLGGLFNRKSSVDDISGPIGIVKMVDAARKFGFAYLLDFVALISINLAVLNLVPFPALDGGRVLFVIIETVKRSPIKASVTNMVNAVGFGLLILLMLIITVGDIVKLF